MGDSSALASQMQEVLQNPERIAALGQTAKQRVQHLYRRKATVEVHADAYLQAES
jgi:hypothetical protein